MTVTRTDHACFPVLQDTIREMAQKLDKTTRDEILADFGPYLNKRGEMTVDSLSMLYWRLKAELKKQDN